MGMTRVPGRQIKADSITTVEIKDNSILLDDLNLAINPSVTVQGNTFNGALQLVKLDANGKLPAIDGSQLTGISGGGSVSTVKVTKSYADFSTAALTNTINLVQMPAGAALISARTKHSASFTGGGATSSTIGVGDSDFSTNTGVYGSSLDVFAAPTPTGQRGLIPGFGLLNQVATTQITITLDSDVNLDQLTAGSVDVWLTYVVHI